MLLWILNIHDKFEVGDLLSFVVISLIIIFGIVIGVSRIKSAKPGQHVEDELSKKYCRKLRRHPVIFLCTYGL